MTEEFVVAFGRDALIHVLMIASPMLIGGLIVGVTISIFQSVTQLQEQTLVFVPKILAVFVLAMIFTPWMLTHLLEFLVGVLSDIPYYAR